MNFSRLQVYELKFILKMKHMTQMPFSLDIADKSKYFSFLYTLKEAQQFFLDTGKVV